MQLKLERTPHFFFIYIQKCKILRICMPVFYFQTKTISTDLITEKDMISDAFLKINNKKTSTGKKIIYTSFCFNSFFAVDNQQILAKNNQWVFKKKKKKWKQINFYNLISVHMLTELKQILLCEIFFAVCARSVSSSERVWILVEFITFTFWLGTLNHDWQPV